jgi:hypothetical protein
MGSPLQSGGAGWLPLLVGAVLAAGGLVPRLRRATGVQREQLKWITYAAALQGAAWIFLAFDLGGILGELASYAVFATLGLIPIAAGIAILRYRLYDIDVVIRRTVVYAALVVVLGAVYLGLVLTLQTALSGLTGSGALPVAISTLAIAGLFGPVRARVREMVDRRFYRSRYDAQRTLEQFVGRLRDEVDLETLTQELAGIAARTMRPVSASVWLRQTQPEGRRSR